jgi:hypothetical protein
VLCGGIVDVGFKVRGYLAAVVVPVVSGGVGDERRHNGEGGS